MYDPPNKMHLEFNFQKEIQQTICLKAQVNTISQRQAQYWIPGAPENKLAIEMNIFIFEISFLQKFDSILFLWLYGAKENCLQLKVGVNGGRISSRLRKGTCWKFY